MSGALSPICQRSERRFLIVVLACSLAVQLIFPSPARSESVRQLTFDPSLDWEPVWSPDGASIVFVSARNGVSNIWRMPAEGEYATPATLLSDDSSSNWDPSLSPDGSNIVFVSNRTDSDREIWRMTASGDSVTRLTYCMGFYDLQPAWSPDGNTILFVSDRNGCWDLWLMPAEGGEAWWIVSDDADDYHPAWSPDGRSIAFMSSRSGNPDIWVMPAGGPGEVARQLTFDPGDDMNPSWSPDGTKIAFTSNRTKNREVWIMDARGETFGLARVTENVADDRQPRWSPDGTKLLFASTRSGNWDIWLADCLPTLVRESSWGRIKARFR